jgi:hypothetical protein
MLYQRSHFITGLILLLSLNIAAQNITTLHRSSPEKEGVSSAGILNFINAANASKHEFHSFMFLRHGKVISEGWWNPYKASLKHTMYSCSKSFTATAVGFAVTEKKLSLDDKVVSFFPNELPDTISENLKALTIKDVLSMSDGQEPDPTFTVVTQDSNWVKSFLATPVIYKPGTKFLYNSLGTYMLSAIVQKVTGENVIDYLRPKLFSPLGITDIDWEVDPKGINTGGWGLRIRTEDLAKFGQLFLQKGKWNDKQILPVAWIEEASTVKIIQHPELSQAKKDSSDWEQGYCYQMWRCRNNAFRGDGAFGQFIIVMPDQDAVIAITAETPDMQDEINLVWKYLLPAIKKNPLSADKKAGLALRAKLVSLALPLPVKADTSFTNAVSGKAFAITGNDSHITNMAFKFSDNTCTVTLKTDTTQYMLDFKSGGWQNGETTKPGPYLLAAAKANHVGLPPFKIAGSYNWKDAQTLELILRYVERPHSEKMLCHFDGDKITVDLISSISPDKKVTLEGNAN